MKKYLIPGALALFACATLTSCHDDGSYGSVVEGKLQTYEQVFKQEFGTINPNQDWGFGAGSVAARTRAYAAQAGYRTRANAGDNYPATSEGINANANEWADPDKEFGGWVVPDPLTPKQKELVRLYFQSHPNIQYEDPEWRHFFIQQVYKGGDDPAETSAENIIAANGSVYDSDNMNLLTVGQNHQHINNFNGGTCSTNDDVLDNGGNVNDGPFHSDEIMLMVNIDDTSCFGYHETGSSTHHDNKAALVGWQTIRTWARQQGIYTEDILNDGWNRSFIGFDLAIQEGEQAYAKDKDGNVIYASYDQAPESPAYAWDGEKVFPIKEITEIAHTWYKEEVIGDYLDEYKTIFGKGYLTTNENFYVAGDKVVLDQSYQNGETQASSLTDIKNAVIIKDLVYNGVKRQAVLNLVKIKQLVDQGYLPVMDNSLTEWVKVGTSDGYFTDWIVTVTEAQRIDDDDNPRPDPDTTTIPTEDSGTNYTIIKHGSKIELVDAGRVMCEDLGTVSASDIDFNDVVFDVYLFKTTPIEVIYTREGENGRLVYSEEWPEGSETYSGKVFLLAAGGTLPITVAGKSVNGTFDSYLDTKYIINTIEDTDGAYGNVWQNYTEAASFDITDYDNIADIPIVVRYGSELLKLDAYKGAAPHKICVPIKRNGIFTKWPLERTEISLTFPRFSSYVGTGSPDSSSYGSGLDENGNKVTNYGEIINEAKDPNNFFTNPTTGTYFTGTVSYTEPDTTERYEFNESLTEEIPDGGYQPGDPVLIRKRN